MAEINLTTEDYLYFEALAKTELLNMGETQDFIAACATYVEEEDQQAFITELTDELAIEERSALEIAEAIRLNIIHPGTQAAGNIAGTSTSSIQSSIVSPLSPRPQNQMGQVRIPAQQAQFRPAAMQQPISRTMPPPAPAPRPVQQQPRPIQAQAPIPQSHPRPVQNPAPIQPISMRPAVTPPPPAPPQPARELPKIPVGFTAFGPLNAQQGNKTGSGAPQISVYTQKNISAPSSAVFPSKQADANPADTDPAAQKTKPATPKAYDQGKDPYRESI